MTSTITTWSRKMAQAAERERHLRKARRKISQLNSLAVVPSKDLSYYENLRSQSQSATSTLRRQLQQELTGSATAAVTAASMSTGRPSRALIEMTPHVDFENKRLFDALEEAKQTLQFRDAELEVLRRALSQPVSASSTTATSTVPMPSHLPLRTEPSTSFSPTATPPLLPNSVAASSSELEQGLSKEATNALLEDQAFLVAEVERLQQQIVNLELQKKSDLDRFESILAKQQLEIDRLLEQQKELESVNADLRQQQTQPTTSESEVTMLKREVDKLRSTLTEFCRVKEKDEAEIAEEMLTQQNEIERLQHELQAANERFATAEVPSFANECEVDETSNSVLQEEIEKEKAMHLRAQASWEAKERDLQAQLQQMNNEIDIVKAALIKRTNEVERLVEYSNFHIDQWKSLSASQSNSIDTLRKEKASLAEALEKANKQVSKAASSTSSSYVHVRSGAVHSIATQTDAAEFLSSASEPLKETNAEVAKLEHELASVQAQLREQIELTLRIKRLLVAVTMGHGEGPKVGSDEWESMQRERIQQDMILQQQLQTAWEKASRCEALEEERDAWKASTRQLESSVVTLSSQCRKLEQELLVMRRSLRSMNGTDFQVQPMVPVRILTASTSQSQPPSPHTLPKETLAMRSFVQDPEHEPQLDFSRTGCAKCRTNLIHIV